MTNYDRQCNENNHNEKSSRLIFHLYIKNTELRAELWVLPLVLTVCLRSCLAGPSSSHPWRTWGPARWTDLGTAARPVCLSPTVRPRMTWETGRLETTAWSVGESEDRLISPQEEHICKHRGTLEVDWVQEGEWGRERPNTIQKQTPTVSMSSSFHVNQFEKTWQSEALTSSLSVQWRLRPSGTRVPSTWQEAAPSRPSCSSRSRRCLSSCQSLPPNSRFQYLQIDSVVLYYTFQRNT